ncbi:MAG: hypothetical protein LKJ83_09460 [Eubacteriaceae bacterium]|jgi:hypothetical protein|nr:hypothetical protein [Eubacteriaceae bacterium]
MKKKAIVIIIAAVLVVSGITVCYRIDFNLDPNLNYTHAYVVGNKNVKGKVDVKYFSDKGKAFDIGANKNGYAVFKDPKGAMNKVISDYGDGIKQVREEKGLSALSFFRKSYDKYKDYDATVSSGTSAAKEQAAFVSSFVDIYENSCK